MNSEKRKILEDSNETIKSLFSLIHMCLLRISQTKYYYIRLEQTVYVRSDTLQMLLYSPHIGESIVITNHRNRNDSSTDHQ